MKVSFAHKSEYLRFKKIELDSKSKIQKNEKTSDCNYPVFTFCL